MARLAGLTSEPEEQEGMLLLVTTRTLHLRSIPRSPYEQTTSWTLLQKSSLAFTIGSFLLSYLLTPRDAKHHNHRNAVQTHPVLSDHLTKRSLESLGRSWFLQKI